MGWWVDGWRLVCDGWLMDWWVGDYRIGGWWVGGLVVGGLVVGGVRWHAFYIAASYCGSCGLFAHGVEDSLRHAAMVGAIAGESGATLQQWAQG